MRKLLTILLATSLVIAVSIIPEKNKRKKLGKIKSDA